MLIARRPDTVEFKGVSYFLSHGPIVYEVRIVSFSYWKFFIYVTGQNYIQVKIFNLGWFPVSFCLLAPIIHDLGLGDKEIWAST